MAHELRNPLNVVKTSVYYLLNARNPTPEKKAEHLRRIERHVELADNVITALSNFARMPVPELRPIAVEPLVREVLEINPPGEPDRGRGRLPAGLPHVLGDGDQLRIVLGNLIRNARDAMPQGGRLTIAGREVDGRVEVVGRRHRRRDRAGGPGPDHGAALLDQGPRAGPGACHRPVDPREESGETPGRQRAGPRQHLHGPTDSPRPAKEPHA